jgi:exodeoxyribonuclease VII small subunit
VNNASTGQQLHSLQALSLAGSFEQAMTGLEQVVARLEEGQLPIGEAVEWYEVGLALSQRCSGLLKQTELHIQTLESTYDVNQFSDADEAEPLEP